MKADLLLGHVIAFMALLISNCGAQEILQPLPNGSSNAALHYQRAILLLGAVDASQKKQLQQSIWEIVTPQMTAQQQDAITQLLFTGRHAMRAGIVGSQQTSADFGVDLTAYGSALYLPHVEPLREVANLVALYGLHQQGDEKWPDAAETFLSVARIGRHLTEQRTIGESIKGIRILESGYYCLATWAARCPDPETIKAARGALMAIGADAVSPIPPFSTEATLIDLRLTQLEHAYPDGNWPEILLAATNVVPAAAGTTDWRELAKSEVIKRGVPAKVFDNIDEFHTYIHDMRETNRKFYAQAIAAFSLPPEQAIAAGKQVHTQFAGQLTRLGDANVLSPAEIAAFYTTHDTAYRLLDITLALCGQREEGLFPADLNAIASIFGGQLPTSPVGAKAVEYKTTADRTGFRIAFPKAMVGDVEVPEVAFEYNFAAAGR